MSDALDEMLATASFPPNADQCREFARRLEVDGLSVALIGQEGWRRTLCASSPESMALDEWQFTLDEGPCLTAAQRGEPVFAPDLADPASTSWPRLAARAVELGFAGIGGVPLRTGVAVLGAVNLQTLEAGVLTEERMRSAASLAHVLGRVLVQRLAEDLATVVVPDERDRVQQAAGMASLQLGLSIGAALDALRAYAWLNGRQLIDVAAAVVDRRLRLDRKPAPS